jgi:cytoskeletal protein CcmA (bactofilin family)
MLLAAQLLPPIGSLRTSIYVEGTVNGKLHARTGIELSLTAKVKGSIQYDADLDMHPGARISSPINGPEAKL